MTKTCRIPEVKLLFLRVVTAKHLVPVWVAPEAPQDLKMLVAPLAVQLDNADQVVLRLAARVICGQIHRLAVSRLLNGGLLICSELVYHRRENVRAELGVLLVLAVHERHDNEELLKQRILLEELELGNDMLRKPLADMIEAEGPGHTTIDIPRHLIAEKESGELAVLIELPVPYLSVADVEQVLLEE